MIIKLISIILGAIAFYRASSLASGQKYKKIFEKESFLFWQKLLALYYLSFSLVYLLKGTEYFYWFHIANLVLVGLFYLQPTPRITKQLSIGFTIFNIIALIFIFS